MFNHRLEHQGRTRGFLIETRAAGGWDVLEEQDRRVVREVHYDDWHRVERQLNVFAMRVEILKNEGWVPVAADATAPLRAARRQLPLARRYSTKRYPRPTAVSI